MVQLRVGGKYRMRDAKACGHIDPVTIISHDAGRTDAYEFKGRAGLTGGGSNDLLYAADGLYRENKSACEFDLVEEIVELTSTFEVGKTYRMRNHPGLRRVSKIEGGELILTNPSDGYPCSERPLDGTYATAANGDMDLVLPAIEDEQPATPPAPDPRDQVIAVQAAAIKAHEQIARQLRDRIELLEAELADKPDGEWQSDLHVELHELLSDLRPHIEYRYDNAGFGSDIAELRRLIAEIDRLSSALE